MKLIGGNAVVLLLRTLADLCFQEYHDSLKPPMFVVFLQEKEEGVDLEKEIFEVEEPAEPTPTLRQRLVTSITGLKTRLADLFVHFVILPDSKLRLIKYINCLFVFATTLTITYMVRNFQVSKVPFLNRSD